MTQINYQEKVVSKMQNRSSFNIFKFVTNKTQCFFIWWTGADNDSLPAHARKAYAGLGGMALVSTTLATVGGFTFIFISLGSLWGGILGGSLTGSFMWGMDRSILGFSNHQETSNSNTRFTSTFWIKLSVNVAFSTILTVPVSTFMLSGSLQESEIKKVESEIEQIDQKIEKVEQNIVTIQKKVDWFKENWRQGGRADGTRNEQFYRDRETADKNLNLAIEEKEDLLEQKNSLGLEVKQLNNGQIQQQTSLKFPNLFNYVMTQATWTDNLLSFLLLTVTSLMGAGAVLIKTLIFTDDAYNKKIEQLEADEKAKIWLESTKDLAVNGIYNSILETEQVDQNLIDEIKNIKNDHNTKVIELYRSLYNESYEKIKTEIEKQKLEKDRNLNGHNSENNNLSTESKNQNNHKNGHKAEQTMNADVSKVIDNIDNNVTNARREKPEFISRPRNKGIKDDKDLNLNGHISDNNNIDNNVSDGRREKPEFISRPRNEDIKDDWNIDDPWENSSSNDNTVNGDENSSGTTQDFMDIFNSVDKKND